MHYQLDGVLISKIDSSTGAHTWTYRYPFTRSEIISAFQRKFLSTPKQDVIIGVFNTANSASRIRYLRLIIDQSTGEPINSSGDMYWESTGFTNSFELLGVTIEHDESIRTFYYDGSSKAGCPCMYYGTLLLSGASNSRINVKRRMSRYPSPFSTF